MKFVDMFCGMGTIRMGMEQAGHECVYSIEWDKHKRRIYSVIFGNKPEGQDIRSVRAVDIPETDCWCFGAPCQDFSIAGKREGLEGDRSSLVREVFRLIREIKEEYRPKYLLYENVKGMFSSNKGFDYFEILFEMDKLGYDIEWQLLNSKDFGVPQNRERVFTIGHLRGRSGRKVFPIGGQSNPYNTIGKSTKTAVARTLTAGGHSGGNHSGMTVLACLTPDRLEKRQNGRRFKEEGEPMFTLTKQDIHGVMITKPKFIPGPNDINNTLRKGGHGSLTAKHNFEHIYDGKRIRRLTPKECWRLQGIPDFITDKVIESGISDTQMYRAAGDACTKNVIYEIAKRMD